MMPTTLANARKCRFAKAHFEFMPEHDSDNQFLTLVVCALAAGQRRGKDIRGMRWILLPINVVVIHAADHQRIGKGGGDRINTLASADNGRKTASADFVQHAESDLHVVLLVTTQGAPDGIEQEALGLINGVLRKLIVFERCRPTGHLRGDGFFQCDSFFSGQTNLLNLCHSEERTEEESVVPYLSTADRSPVLAACYAGANGSD